MFSKNYKKVKILISAVFISSMFFSPILPVGIAFASELVTENIYCPNGGDLTYEKFVEAKNAGLISFGIVTNTSTNLATVNLLNQTGCSIPMSLSVYKMFVNQGESNWLSTQQLFDSTGIINAAASTIYEVNLPSCMAQIDFWYGLAPTTLLDSNPYGGPTPPVVVDWKFANDNLCSNIPINTPPTITLIGANPLNLTVNTPFVDPGATATDLEDGDLTSAIVKTGTVNASTTGTYILTYVVKDSGNLYATTTRTVNVNPVIVPPVNPPTNNGGGGSSSGSTGGHRHPVIVGEILGATSCSYLRDYLKIDWQNDNIEVLKLQSFLNVFEKENLSYTGVFNQSTFEAVQRFQIKYKGDILEPWGDKVTTGFVYILTKKKVNEIYCNTIYPLSQTDQNEINTFKNSGKVGSSFDSGVLDSGVIFISDDITKESPVVELKDNSLSQSALKNIAVSLFALPQKIFSDWKYFIVFLILLAIIIIVIRFLAGSEKDSDDNSDFKGNSTASATEESPVIILPGTSEILPDEEIIIENPEEEPEETLIAVPDLRDDSDKQKTS